MPQNIPHWTAHQCRIYQLPTSLIIYIFSIFSCLLPHYLPSSSSILMPFLFSSSPTSSSSSLARRILSSVCSDMSPSEQRLLLERLLAFRIRGRDKRGHRILLVVGKFFPARIVGVDVLRNYLEEKIFPSLEKKPFSVLYVHTGVQRSENFPGITALRSLYDAIPINVKENLETVYFLHPDLQARLFLATFGRIFFSGGLYGKLKYVSRIDLLWEHVKRNEIELPEFVHDHDEDLEYRPMMDYGLESDHPRVYGAPAPAVDSAVPTYSMRCIS